MKHRQPITQVSNVAYGTVATTSLDGRLVIWDTAKTCPAIEAQLAR